AAPQRAMEVFREAFDAAHEYGALLITVWHPFLSGRLARLRAIVKWVEYMRAAGQVWFPRLDEVADHVQSAMREGTWKPRVEKIPPYEIRATDFVHLRKDSKQA